MVSIFYKKYIFGVVFVFVLVSLHSPPPHLGGFEDMDACAPLLSANPPFISATIQVHVPGNVRISVCTLSTRI